MSSTGSYRNGSSGSRGRAVKLETQNSGNSYSSSSFKSKGQQLTGVSSNIRRSSNGSTRQESAVSGRVRVAVRLRPRNAEEIESDSDLADCVELQPELRRLKLRKNNWDLDTYEFDEVLTEFASQKRVYEIVAKPVVESVLDGYNGTVMAYGQTGTGKTYTLGQLGEDDAADRGIMLRAMEDILAEVSPENDSVSVSYLQVYMETIQDLLNPANDNISIVEDPKSGDVFLPGATIVEIWDHKGFMELVKFGEANRFAANNKLNTESSRSHAILMVHIKRFLKERNSTLTGKTLKPSIMRKSKLVIVDLAGSERVDKTGSEGHALEEAKCINLSLSALGKCINALAENNAHVPIRDSKLTRLLRDSFGGTARTSLVITIGPSPRHRGETFSTVMFGQRAMKIENMVKLKEDFDYKSLSRRLEIQLDKLVAEHERQQRSFQDEIDRISSEAHMRVTELENVFSDALEKEKSKHHNRTVPVNKSNSEASVVFMSGEVEEMKRKLQNEANLRKAAETEVENLKKQLMDLKNTEAERNAELMKLRSMLENEAQQKEQFEQEIEVLQSQLLRISFEADESRKNLDLEEHGNGSLDFLIPEVKQQLLRDSGIAEKALMVKLSEQATTVGLYKILKLLDSEDADVRIHAVKIVANLAAEESNQEKIVEAGGIKSLLVLLRSSNDETVHRVAAGALANLAMSETNQELIVSQGGISLLSLTAAKAKDPQTLRMVAGAIANLCGNDKLLANLRSEGGIKALLGMVSCKHTDVLAQVARAIANFANCESRASARGSRSGKSVLIEDGALPWIVQNADNEAMLIKRHIELAICHLGQQEANAKEMINKGALLELVHMSRDRSREDIRVLALRTINSCPMFQAELKKLRIEWG